MRAFRLTDWGAAPSHEEVPAPVPGPGQVLVRVAGCGLCRSDLTMRQMPRPVGEKLGWRMPFTLGHETAGWLDEYVVADRRSVLPLGSLDPRHAGPLTDAGATAYHAVRRALPRIVPGGTAVVIGAGGLGAFAVQFLRVLTAAKVIAVDPSPSRLAYAESAGAHETVSDVELLPRRLGADAVLDFVGTGPTIAAGIAAVRPGGAYGLIGSAGGRLDRPWFGTLPRDGEVYTFQGSAIADAQEVIALAGAGLIRNQVEEFAFEKTEEAYDRLASGTLTGRAVVLLQ